MAGKAKSME
jgi:hypothetical protein